MEQVLLNKPEPELKLEALVLEKVPFKPDFLEEAKPSEKKKPVKNVLLKFLNKGKYNAKYLEEFVSLDAAKRKVYYRNYGNL